MAVNLKPRMGTTNPISQVTYDQLRSLIPRVPTVSSPISPRPASHDYAANLGSVWEGTDWTRIFNDRLRQQKSASSEPPSSLASRVQSTASASAGSAGGAGGAAGSVTSSSPAATGATNTYEQRPTDNTYGYGNANIMRDPNAIKDSRGWFTGRVANAAIPQLASDPEQISYQWANSKGYGRGVEGLLNSYADPYAVGLLSGQTFATDEDYLGFVGGFNDLALSGSSGQSPFDPRSAIRRVFGASGDINTDPNVTNTDGGTMDLIGQKLYGGQNAVNPSGQVGETLKFLQASLTGVMSPVVMNAYLATIQELGQAFLQWKNSPEGAKSPLNFGNFVLQRLGPSAGL